MIITLFFKFHQTKRRLQEKWEKSGKIKAKSMKNRSNFLYGCHSVVHKRRLRVFFF